jgi:hypothetical protein
LQRGRHVTEYQRRSRHTPAAAQHVVSPVILDRAFATYVDHCTVAATCLPTKRRHAWHSAARQQSGHVGRRTASHTCIASTANRRCMWFGWSSDKASFFQRAAPSLPADLVGTRDQMLALMTPRAKRTQHTCEFAFRQESLRKRPGPQRFREPTFGRLLSARCENGYRGRKLLVPAATGTLRVGLAAATPLSPSSHKPR